jgi:hypothetical protein
VAASADVRGLHICRWGRSLLTVELAYLCTGCGRSGTSRGDLTAQGCEGYPQPMLPLTKPLARALIEAVEAARELGSAGWDGEEYELLVATEHRLRELLESRA